MTRYFETPITHSPFDHVSGEDRRHPTEDGVVRRNTFTAPVPDDVARDARGDLEPLPTATVETADCRPCVYEHPRSHMYRTYRSKQRSKQHLCVSFFGSI